MSQSFLILFLASTLVSTWALAPAHASPRSTQAPKKDLQESLKAALVEAKSKLGKLEEWQSTLFDEEAVPQYSRFIRDYRPSANGVTADIDLDSLRNYLAYAAPRGAKADALKLYVVMKGDESCKKCVEAAPLLRKLLKARIERRGFVPSFVNADASTNEKVSALAERTESAGALLVEWQLLPVDSIDTAHADENHYRLRVFQSARIAGAGSTHEYKTESRLELLEQDSFATAAERVLTDSFTDLGSKVQVARSETESGATDELFVEVTGIRDFAQFTVMKNQIQNSLRSWGTIEERKVARGWVSFAIRTSHKVDELRQALAPLRVASGSNERSLKVAAE